MQFGDISLHVASVGSYRDDGGRLFGLVPKVLWEQVARPDEQNRLCVGLRCLLIQADGQCILVGAGCGHKPSAQQDSTEPEGGSRLLRELERLGVGPQDVDLVVNTHLHTHHCGGNTMHGPDGTPVPTFPRAAYCVQRLELADAYLPNERTRAWYLEENIRPLERDGRLRVLYGDTRLTGHVRATVTPGHTRAHQSVVIESAGHKALFLGDAASWPVHLERLSWVPAYDAEPLASIETKRNLARWAVETGALLIFEQHPEIEAGYLHATERPERFRLEPVAISA
jgi:glyoxylase-like metal-dependent hydrolase (beta-lactamase superfamily II)